METTGKVVVTLGKLAPGMKPAENQFHPRQPLFLVDVHRHTPAVILYRQGAVSVQHHIHSPGVAGEGLVHTVVNHFLGQVVGPAGVGVHPRALAHRVQAAEDFNGVGVIGFLAHRKGTAPDVLGRVSP